MMAKIDLHVHSHCSSDGDYSPEELVTRGLQAGLTHLAIADHNTVRGISAAQGAAEGTSLTVIPGVELDCIFDGVNLHLLGYGMDHTATVFAHIEKDLHQQEQANSDRLTALVRQLGIEFDDRVIEELAFDGVVTGEMIAEAALMYDAEGKNPLLDPYRDDGERSDNPFVNFYWDYCAQGKPAYVPMRFMDLGEAVAVIRSNHGVPVLAHPGVNIKEDPVLLQAIIAVGIAGLEVYSSYHTCEQAGFYRQAALDNDLLLTCGSDFHGKTKQSIHIGGVDCEGQEGEIVNALTRAIALG